MRTPPSGRVENDDDVGLGDGVIVRRGVTRCQGRFSFFTHPVSCRDGRQAKSAVAVYGKMGRLPDEEVAVKIDRSVEAVTVMRNKLKLAPARANREANPLGVACQSSTGKSGAGEAVSP